MNLAGPLPKGKLFYVVTPAPDDPKRKYLHSIERPKVEFGVPGVQLSPIRRLAQGFDNHQLAKAYADFLNGYHTLPFFYVSTEAA